MKEVTQALMPLPESGEAERLSLKVLAHPGAYDRLYGDAAGPKAHLRDYWRKVRAHLWLVASIALLGTVLMTVYMARQPDIYQAKARVQVDLENSGPGPSGPSGGGFIVVSNPANDPSYFNTQLQILKGEALQRRVVKTLDLEHNRGFLDAPADESRTTWQSLKIMFGFGERKRAARPPGGREANVPVTDSVAPATSREDLAEAERLAPLVGRIRRGLVIEPVRETSLPVKDTRLIEIRFSHTNPQVAAKIVNTVAETFTLSNLERKVDSNTTTGNFLQKRVAELQAQIRNGEERLINYARENQILSLDASQNTVVERLTGLNRQLLEAENERKLAEAAYRAALAPGAAVALAEADARQIADAEAKLNELRQRREELLVDNTEEWYEVKSVTQQIGALEKQVQEIGRAHV